MCTGERNLQGLHKLAAQGDRDGIMTYMKVIKTSITIQPLIKLCESISVFFPTETRSHSSY